MIKIISTAMILSLAACAPTPPQSVGNGCDILNEKKSWYKALKKSEDIYGTPMHVQMAIMRQESSFRHDAKASRDYIFWVIPWGPKTSAYGYAQAQDATWDWYISRTGNKGANRGDFADAADFVGWYTDESHRVLKIPKTDAYNQYLAYHEGQGGFKRKTYKQKPWLMKVAHKVERYSNTYAAQLKLCEGDLDKKKIWFF